MAEKIYDLPYNSGLPWLFGIYIPVYIRVHIYIYIGICMYIYIYVRMCTISQHGILFDMWDYLSLLILKECGKSRARSSW